MWLDAPVRGVMLDIVGVLYESGAGAIEGSVRAIERLRENDFRVMFVSNESTQPTKALITKLLGLGFNSVVQQDVLTPVPAIMDLLHEEGLNPHLLVHPGVVPEFDSIVKADQPKTCVVVGDSDSSFSFENMNAAFNCLLEMKEPKLFCLGKGKYYRHHGRLQLDVGAFTAALEFATGVAATVVGKPAALYYQRALRHLGLQPHEVVMVGDDLYGDVLGSRSAGCRAVLVRTGKFQPAWAEQDGPSHIAENLAAAVDDLVAAKLSWG